MEHGRRPTEAPADWLGETIELARTVDQAPMAIGRIVHYRSRGSADGVFAKRCVAAVVTEVRDVEGAGLGARVSLAVLNPSGLFFDSDLYYDKTDFDRGTWHRLSDCIFDDF